MAKINFEEMTTEEVKKLRRVLMCGILDSYKEAIVDTSGIDSEEKKTVKELLDQVEAFDKEITKREQGAK